MKTGKKINRIVVGDVGSGKTIVAFLSALAYLKNLVGGKTCMLAPTEVLAYQHYINLLEFKNNLDQNEKESFPVVVYLSSKQNFFNNFEKLSKSKIEKAIKELDSKENIFFLGTHSLLHKDYVNPDLVMVDEQHRFGVEQRKKLSQLGDAQISPHYISFSATPIPRTLALSIYSSLKPHFLETLPGRKKIKTKINYFENFSSQIVSKIKEKLDINQKVYVVCTKIEKDGDGNTEDIWSTTETAKKLEAIFPGKILEVHGKKAEKKEILDEFKSSKDKQILVTTTVVEVGVDVSQATLMIILNSERYGLAALHQLRGRVGRNNYDNNECELVTWEKYGRPKRLGILETSDNGFEIAQRDLEIRGGGDLYGKVQSGFDNEIEELMGLDSQKYEQILELAQSIDFNDLKSQGLERLENYVIKQSKEIWEE